ncbi:MAG: hypothetical protein HY860_05285 [Chlamydiales bacterium]|nr:hypothetical protein [Chlamydiales bacterium]
MCITLEQLGEKGLIDHHVDATLMSILQQLSINKEIDIAILEEVASNLENNKLDNVVETVRYLQLLLPFSYAAKKCNALFLLNTLLKSVSESFFFTLPIVQVYMAVIYEIADTSTLDLDLSSYEDSFLERYFYQFKEEFSFAIQEIVLLYLLYQKKEEKLSKLGKALAFFHQLFEKGDLSLLFIQQDYYNKTNHLAITCLLGKLFQLCKIDSINVEEKMLQLNVYSLPAYLQVLYLLLNTCKEQEVKITNESSSLIHHIKEKDFSAIYTLYGKNTSIGCLAKQTIAIQAFGPHYAPLDSSKRFGIFHPCQEVQRGAVTREMQGWTRTCFEEDDRLCYGPDWLHINIKKENNFIIEVTPKLYSKETLYFTFFVKNSFILIDNQYKILHDSIDHFCGKAKKITLHSGHHQLLFESNGCEVEVLPLAGSDFFWGADFLIAYKLNNINKKFSLEIY